MQFEFSEDQETLRDHAVKFLRNECSSAVVRDVLDSDKQFHADLWTAIVDMGWTGVAIPEEFGGLGAGHLELCVIAEELGRVLAPVPFSSTIYLTAEALMMSDNIAQKEHWLPKIVSGEAVGALAMAEGAGSPSWSQFQTKVLPAEDGRVRLTGVKWPVLDGMEANVAIVPATGDDGLGFYLVELGQEGVVRTPEPSIDESRPQARLQFNGAYAERIGASNAVTVQELLNRAAILFAFEQLGGAAACLEMAVAYAKERYAFGRAIGSFQAIKHKLSNMFAELELARSNCYYAAWALSVNDPVLAEAAAVARLSVSKVYFNCAKENIQIHGGIGFTWDLDAHLFYRRSKLLSSTIGGSGRWRDNLIRSLETKEAAIADAGDRAAILENQ